MKAQRILLHLSTAGVIGSIAGLFGAPLFATALILLVNGVALEALYEAARDDTHQREVRAWVDGWNAGKKGGQR